jgi:NAD(P)-dependent dehydrogenase (short-subunit alcohol dehydrogenase family)
MSAPVRTVRFSEEDLDLFSEASGDCNPLHLSSEYARATAYGQRVVFGALGAVACLAEIAPNAGHVLQLTADFSRPMFLHTEYSVESKDHGEARFVRLLDGSTPVLVLRAKLGPSSRHETAVPGHVPSAHFDRSEAQILNGEPEPGHTLSGNYTANSSALERLRKRWKVAVDPFTIQLLLWSSYVVGMELPGRSALFFRLNVSLENAPLDIVPLSHTVRALGFDRNLGQLRAQFTLQTAGDAIATGEYRAFVRPDLADSTDEIPVGEGLSGKTVFLVGSSRGLGATLRRVLEAQGAQVLGLSRGRETSSENVISGDASDPSVLAAARTHILDRFGHLDFLICNACPSILPLRLEPAILPRIDSYISHATALVAQPLAAFLDLLEASGGCSVVISSMAVENPVREWPHYVAAKKAVEGLAQVAVLQFPRTSSLIVRPEKLLTEMTNTPMGRRGAISPTAFAKRIAERMQQSLRAGAAEIFR